MLKFSLLFRRNLASYIEFLLLLLFLLLWRNCSNFKFSHVQKLLFLSFIYEIHRCSDILQKKGEIFLHEMNIKDELTIFYDLQLINSEQGIDVAIVKDENIYEISRIPTFFGLIIGIQILIHAVRKHVFASTLQL